MEPKIRLKGFSGEWETCTINDICEVNPKSTLPDVFEYVDLESVVGTEMISHRTEKRETAPSRAQRLAKKWDIFYQTVRPYQKNNYLFDRDEINYVFSTGYAQLRTKINQGYLFTLIQSPSFVNKVLLECTGTSYPAINPTNLSKIKIEIINNKDFQHTIASFFQYLDSLIQSTTKKIESLKQVKAASLQSMFPQEGETTPRVRFKGFEGEWIKIKFAAFAEINRGLTYTPNNIVENGVRVLRSSNIDEDVFTISNEDVFVTPNCVNICYAKDGDILVTAANGSPRLVGKHAIIRNTGSIPVVAGGFMYLVTSQESEFLNASMSSNWYWSFIKIGVAGGNGSIGNLNRNDLEETVFPIPSLKEERDMIASYFTSLDSQITLQTQHLEKLKQIKSACLENMFV